MTPVYVDEVKEQYQQQRKAHWDAVADKMRRWTGLSGYYHRRLNQVYASLIPPGSRVLDIGCGDGRLLASLKPALGVGVEVSDGMAALARERNPQFTYIVSIEEEFEVEGTFDYILFSDILNEVWDVQALFDHVKQYCSPRTRIMINTYDRLWEYGLMATEKLGLAKPMIGRNWLTRQDINSLLDLAGFVVIKATKEILFPIGIPLLSPFLNKFLARFWPFDHLALTHFIIARPRPANCQPGSLPSVSVLVPARNESGNIESIFQRVPEMGAGTEIIFVEGHSTDDTFDAITAGVQHHPERRCVVLKQEGKGKGDAVRAGFARASGDILMILDADLTVAPEDLPRFYDALTAGKGDLINGVRLVYPMQDEAMRFFNLIGNKFFSWAFSWLLGQPIKDTLCGTKVLWRTDYERIAANRHILGEFDPFGDFDLLFGASLLSFKIIDMPIRYRARTYGTTNIQRWKHGFLLLRMVMFAARKIKFI